MSINDSRLGRSKKKFDKVGKENVRRKLSASFLLT